MLTVIDIETGSTGTRPGQPMPEDFGLAFARVHAFHEPESINEVWENRWLWIGHAAVTFMVAAAAYAGTKSVVESAFTVFFGFFAYVFILAVLLGAGIAAFDAVWRRFRPDHKQYIEYARALADDRVRFFQWLRLQEFWWQALDGRRFELELAAVLGKLGYGVTRTGRAGDAGVDLVLSRAGHEAIVQCKAHKNLIGPGAVRDLYGTMIHRNAREGWLVTANGFSRLARDFARGK
jgi:hypothetical protein